MNLPKFLLSLRAPAVVSAAYLLDSGERLPDRPRGKKAHVKGIINLLSPEIPLPTPTMTRVKTSCRAHGEEFKIETAFDRGHPPNDSSFAPTRGSRMIRHKRWKSFS